MSCSRRNCESIMCDTYVDGIGYVCRDCQDEFKGYLAQHQIDPRTSGDIQDSLKEFMRTYKKGEYEERNREITVDAFFNEHTR